MMHPITGLRIDYEHVCRTCIHFTDKVRKNRGVQYRTTKCALDPEQRNLADVHGTVWTALPACAKHDPGREEAPTT